MGALAVLKKLLGIPVDLANENTQAGKRDVEATNYQSTIPTTLSQTPSYPKSNEKQATKTNPPDPKSLLNKEKSPQPTKSIKRTKTAPDSPIFKTTLQIGNLIHQERANLTYRPGILNKTFIHIKGIGAQKERHLWESGILTHEDALNSNALTTQRNCLRNSKQDLENQNWQPFYDGMTSKDHWRLFGDLIANTAYVDIETTGLGSSNDIITTAVVHSLQSTHTFVNGMNLDHLPSYLDQFDLIVTYNGKTFDVPFIERFFGTSIRHPHIDLRYILSSMGFKGGLKSCERQLKLPNRNGMEDIDGYTAVLLWNDYRKTGDPKSLETLLAYNFEDSVRLEWLMIEAYNQKVSDLPIETESLIKPSLPTNPFKAHSSIIRRLV